MSQKGSPFPLVAEKIEEELEDYRSKEDDIKRMKSDMGLEGHGTENDAALGLLSDNTQVYIWKEYLMWGMVFFLKIVQTLLFCLFGKLFFVILETSNWLTDSFIVPNQKQPPTPLKNVPAKKAKI